MHSRQGVRLHRPMGEVKTIYYRFEGRWIRAGLLCLNCLLFVPDERFRRPTFSPRIDSKKKKDVTDVKKVRRGSR
jgi:hypothetical protein